MVGCLGSLLGIVFVFGIFAIIGAIVRAVTNIDIMFWVTFIGLIILALPGIFIHLLFDGITDAIEDAQDIADDRELLRELDDE